MSEGDRMVEADMEVEASALDPIEAAGPRWRPHLTRTLVIGASVGLLALVVGVANGPGSSPDERTSSSPLVVDDPPDRVSRDWSALVTSGPSPTTSSTTEPGGDGGATQGSSTPPLGADGHGQPLETPAPEPPPTTTTTVCVDSFDPGCGPFRWSSPPGANRPMVASIELLTEHPVAGGTMSFRVRASDPDAIPLETGLWLAGANEDPGIAAGNCSWHGVYEGYGPWAPPTPQGGSFDVVTSRLAPREAGTYRVYACITSTSWPRYADSASDQEVQSWCPGDPSSQGFEGFTCRDPYGDFAAPYVTIVVEPAPS